MIRDVLFLYCVGAGVLVFFDLSDYFNGIYCDFYLTTMSFLLSIRMKQTHFIVKCFGW